ncbi:hypothetical protein GCM10010168_34140 [Actinoplanes ianthinogenes]|uniref:Beta-lactamase-related domain-containing protein n=1 Tax=Actinoplanes ianthinogenes TaxID=122358 RepID=A0ABM7M5Z2_9ACTN|nr:serine hydrolase domain-containing protein [Actinoplanes ianthinogenes]BCJ47066.1 hypothetical protein Aiant_77230 [Actinoplanes ianthinogenes]GGR13526.1 hypothetical protein GCM10010168_34140 [Actinoplanes ianthinogenes]
MVRTEILVRQGADILVDDTTATRYQLASISKQFTAAAVLMLVEDGRVGLDDRLGRWFGECPQQWRDITVDQLLTHTSGIGHWEDYPGIDLSLRIEPAEMLAAVFREPLVHAPGGPWRYSSPAYVLAAHIAERAADRPYRRFLAERIFEPLGLTGTFAGMPDGQPDVADGHDADGKPVPSWELDVVGMGAGDLWSTAADMLTWIDAVRTGRLLSERHRALMLTERVPTGLADPLATGYGYGVFTGTVAGRPWWQHSGDNAGFKAFIGCVPSTGRRVVLLSNTDATGPGAVRPYLE